MSIQRAEQLKRDLTDKYVVVTEGIPELRRFGGLTGRVKTVNMSCRALVQFNGPADIGWYDIDPTYLKVVDGPAMKAAAAAHEAPATATTAKAAAKPPAGKSPLEMARAQGAAKAETPPASEKKLSPLELARQQGAAKGDAPAPAAAPAPAPSAGGDSGKKLSPLELARMQGAAKSGAAATPAAPPAPAASPAPADSGKKLSPLELARQQGAAKPAGASPSPPAAPPEPAASEPVPPPEPPAAQPAASAAPAPQSQPVDTSNLSTADILALCRQQGAFKG